ncbi:long-chain-fatty-acid--CoA ligase [Kitasatospora sp. NPDC056531]|uniref:long-chain-fatty-acid--CoA ligase n=1 Tax=Kitasatospora sp. NPDC056531 TaxID=3345856 RepID=UPI00367D0569
MHVTQTLHRALQHDPLRPMTVFGDRVRSVAESVEQIARFAGALRSLGVRPGDRVGVLALNSDRYHEYLLAVPWADAVVNPVNTRWSTAEIVYSLQESGTRVLLVDDAFAGMLPALHEQFPELSTTIFIGDGALPEGTLDYEQLITDAEPVEDARRGGDEVFGVFYTGGTTGYPKGVMLSHTNVMTSALGCQAAGSLVSPNGRLLHTAPMFHLADLAIWLCGLLAGSTHVITPAFAADDVLSAISRHQVTDVLLVPTMIQMLVDAPALPEHDLSSLHSLIYGASPISQAVLDRARTAFPAAGFTQAYGMTELSPVTTILSPADHGNPKLRRSAGRSAPHAEVRIVDFNGTEVPRGQVGEVVVRGDHTMLGYWNRPEDTATALEAGWIHTGDGGYMDEHGYVFIVDRIKDMIVSGGENIYSAEVENALAKHPAVAACAVIGVPDPRFGERVHAVVVLQHGQSATEEQLRDACREHIAGYKVPRSVEVVDALPMSGAGKILKRELRRKYWPDGERQVR